MAITNYTELKAAIASWANRSDLTNEIVDAITLCEARLNDMLVIKNMESDEPLTLTIGNDYVPLPTGYISPIAFWLEISGIRIELEQANPEEMPYSVSRSQPQHWSIDGANIGFDCPANLAYPAYLRCIKQSNLSIANPTNYLLTRRPDVYLAGALSELSRKTRDQGLFASWEPRFLDACAGIKAADNRARGKVPLRTDLGRQITGNILTGGD